MARLCAVVLSLLVAGIPICASARPVSYQGGWTIIERTDRQSTAVLVHYTLTPNWSLGWRSEWDRGQDFIVNGVQATWLANRWFGKNYQANLYLTGGAGVATGIDSNVDETVPAVFAGIIADWETRRWFASYHNRVLEAGPVDASFSQAARVGVAPYLGNTNDLHTWLMVEIDHRPDNPEPVGVTPLVRFFKGSAMFEAGWSITDNKPLINFTWRF